VFNGRMGDNERNAHFFTLARLYVGQAEQIWQAKVMRSTTENLLKIVNFWKLGHIQIQARKILFHAANPDFIFMKNKPYWTLLGALLLIFGFTALILQMIGVNWWFLQFLELGGRLFAFVAKILMVLAGVFVIVFAHTDWERERRESSDDSEQ